MRELAWCPVLHPSKAGSYQYDHALEKLDLPAQVSRPIQYAIQHVQGLAWHPPVQVWDEQKECTGDVKWGGMLERQLANWVRTPRDSDKI